MGARSDLIQQSPDIWLRLRVARQNQPAPVEHGNLDLDHLNSCELFEDGCRRQAWCVNEEPVFEGDLKTVSKKSNENVRVGPMFEFMIDGPDP
jgi:hypothetical protein